MTDQAEEGQPGDPQQMPEGLTPQEQEFFKKFGKLPNKKGPMIKNSGKKHFDSADWQMKQAGAQQGATPIKKNGRLVPQAKGMPPKEGGDQ